MQRVGIGDTPRLAERSAAPHWRTTLIGRLGSLRGLLVPALLLALLETVVRVGWIPPYLMPAPSELFVTLLELAEGPLWQHILASTLRVLLGFAIGASLALLLGSAVGISRRLEAYLDPTFQALRAVPGLAWVPLLLIWLGIDETSKVTLIAIGSFFPMYMNLVAGIRNVDRKLVELGELYRLPRLQQIRRIFVPAAQPYLFTGLRNGLSMAWLCVVAAELLAATEGIGYLLTDGRETSRPDLVLVAIVVLALMGKLSDSLLKALEHRALRWRDNFDGEGGGA
ncbi:ABC transporter permease [Pseudomonas kuykendallii]|uniref:ABC transporter permease n=1 Tax=Pseudomonas kuykendallii TaxID=1007099 RepID=A0A2W5CSA6_9PSED|nr:ABC transporter permease [Pseudomonas kuykendallii]PZP22091.1 MAG: ABC transporter permease [Pseudomonas kuykendallii]